MSSKEDAPVIGIDLGGTNITGGLVDAKGKVIAREKIDTKADEGKEVVLKRVASCIKTLAKDGGLDLRETVGVGLGVPGAVDPSSGTVIEAVNLRWKDMPVAKQLTKLIEVPVTIDNDVNVGTWGEYRMGAAKGHKAVLGVFVGTGVGGGIILNGELYTGTYGTAGEIGHTIIDTHAPFGHRTLEQIASRTAIVNCLIAMVSANHESILPELAGNKWPRIRSKVLSRAMAKDDVLTIRVIGDAARAVGMSIAGVVTLLSLDCVVVGGGLTEAMDDRWIKWIRDNFDDAVFPPICKQCKVVASKLGDDAGLIGAAMLAVDRLGKK